MGMAFFNYTLLDTPAHVAQKLLKNCSSHRLLHRQNKPKYWWIISVFGSALPRQFPRMSTQVNNSKTLYWFIPPNDAHVLALHAWMCSSAHALLFHSYKRLHVLRAWAPVCWRSETVWKSPPFCYISVADLILLVNLVSCPRCGCCVQNRRFK